MKTDKKPRAVIRKKDAPSNVSREEIVKKLNEIDDIVTEATSSAAGKSKIALVVGVVVLVGIAFVAGRRRAFRPKTFVTFSKSR